MKKGYPRLKVEVRARVRSGGGARVRVAPPVLFKG